MVDHNNLQVQKFDNHGDFIFKRGSKGKVDDHFDVSHRIGVDKEGNI